MGSGKSTLGKKLSNKLDYDFIDLDNYIENQLGLTISEIFEKEEEAVFRKYETQYLKEVGEKKESIIIALGGGTPCFGDNMSIINQLGRSVYLKYNAGILFSRLKNAKTSRPLLANKSDDELSSFISDLLSQREKYYNQCSVILENKNISVSDVLEGLAQNS